MPKEIPVPNNIPAEEAVIGSLLMRFMDSPPAEILAELGDLKPTDFFREKNGWVFKAIMALAPGGGVDQITVAYELHKRDKLEVIGGPAYLLHCLGGVATSFHLDYYAGIVLDCSRRRQRIEEGGKMIASAYSGTSPPSSPPARGPVKGL